jgi:FlaA1/EpsC-like NDP-sugar epimerase
MLSLDVEFLFALSYQFQHDKPIKSGMLSHQHSHHHMNSREDVDMSKSSTLTQKLALVTGAGSGIGRATAILLGQLGARVIICDRNPTSLQETATLLQNNGVEVYSETADVADWQAMQVLATRVHNKHGALDIPDYP